MPTYKLEYFDLRGLGELSRYVFHVAGQDFEDKRYTHEEWPAVKPSTPFGQIPVLHVDGKQLAQSGAIARFLAREFGLDGKNNWENGLVEQYMELSMDMFKGVVQCFFYEKDEERKKELEKNLNEVVYPKYCGFLEKALEQNEGKYLVGTELTIADLAVLDMFDTPMQHNQNMMDSFPKLKAHRQCIESLPALAGYIKNRKVTAV